MKRSASQYTSWWMLATVFVIVFIGFGCFYSIPLVFPFLVQEHGVSRAEVSFISSLLLLTAGAAGPLVGAVIDKWGARWTFIAGSLFVAISVTVLSHASNLFSMYTAAGLFGLGLAGFSILPTQIILSKWFKGSRGIATGVACSGMELGGTVSTLVFGIWIESFGYSKALLIEAACLCLISVPLGLWILRETPQEVGLLPYGATDGSSEATHHGAAISSDGNSVTYSEAIRSAGFWFFCLSIFCSMFVAFGVIEHLGLYLKSVQSAFGSASRILSTLLFASVGGRLAMGYLNDFLKGPRTMVLACFVLTAGGAMLPAVEGRAGMTLTACLIGFGYGGVLVALTLTATEVFGLHAIGKILGSILIFLTAGGSVGPLAVGYVADKFGCYHPAFMMLTAFSAIATLAAVGIWFTQRSV